MPIYALVFVVLSLNLPTSLCKNLTSRANGTSEAINDPPTGKDSHKVLKLCTEQREPEGEKNSTFRTSSVFSPGKFDGFPKFLLVFRRNLGARSGRAVSAGLLIC